jgi:CheY-like chemotaxis protein
MPNILLVEDEPVLQDAYSTIFMGTEYDVRLARNGQEALELCRTCSYDVILLDLMMPVLDGVGFLREAGLHKHAPGTKIIVFSNISSGGDVGTAMRLGAHAHVLKANLTPRELLDLVASMLSGTATPTRE